MTTLMNVPFKSIAQHMKEKRIKGKEKQSGEHRNKKGPKFTKLATKRSLPYRDTGLSVQRC